MRYEKYKSFKNDKSVAQETFRLKPLSKFKAFFCGLAKKPRIIS
jgi:hypothetical protein